MLYDSCIQVYPVWRRVVELLSLLDLVMPRAMLVKEWCWLGE